MDFKKVEGTPARLEYEELNMDLRNELFWDIAIVSWDEFCFKHPETKETILCTPDSCTRENKMLLLNNSKKFVAFANESYKALSEDEAEQAEQAGKTHRLRNLEKLHRPSGLRRLQATYTAQVQDCRVKKRK